MPKHRGVATPGGLKLENVCGKRGGARSAKKNWDSAQAAYENIMIIFDYIRLSRTLRIHDYDYTAEAQSSALDYNRDMPCTRLQLR